MTAEELLSVDLSDLDKRVLLSGLAGWGGQARCTGQFARAMGYDSEDELHAESPRLRTAITRDQSLSRRDWWRVLLMTEVVFVSDVVGSGVEWATTTGLSDEETIQALRTIQRKLAGAVR